EKGKFVLRWRASSQPLALRNPGKAPGAKEGSGVVIVYLETGKSRAQPLEKGRKIEEKDLPAMVEWKGTEFHVGVSEGVGNWAKTLPASRFRVESRTLRAVDKKTKKFLWSRTLWEWRRLEYKGGRVPRR